MCKAFDLGIHPADWYREMTCKLHPRPASIRSIPRNQIEAKEGKTRWLTRRITLTGLVI